MKKSDITIGTQLIEKIHSKHTEKLHKITIKGIYEGWDYTKNRRYTYYIVMTNEGSYYPAVNSTDNRTLILDGLMGDYTLSRLKRDYNII